MRVTYERDADVLTIEIDLGLPIDHAEEAGPFVLHMAPNGQVTLIEVLDASQVLPALVRAGLRDSAEYLAAGQ